ncbi:MAG: DUF1987 domain-containing protein [Bacteroidales bacterium]|nr:DUF1987 domain-containing protein [Bacteroidales bacterium]
MELKSLLIEPKEKTPKIDLNQLTGDLILSGRSIPENASEVYEKVLTWTNEYIKSPRLTTNFRLNLEYFNTASSIWITKIVKALCSIKGSEYTLLIHLYFDIEDYENLEVEDIREALGPLVAIITTAKISLGIKICETNDKEEIIKESMVLI